jgi:hypothetical protein
LNKPKIVGTRAESAVVRFMRSAGFPQAERRALRGALDAGDITGCPGLALSVKGGQYAKTASDALIAQWLDECMTQTANAGADVGLLVVARAGIGEANAGRWWAVMPGHQYEQLCDGFIGRGEGRWKFGDRGPIRMHLSQACALLVYAGYGSREVAA